MLDVVQYLRDPELSEFFRAFVTISSLPCRQLETVFCADATGLTTRVYRSWFKEKHGNGDSQDSDEDEVNTRGGMKDWVKLHILIGILTQVIVAAFITDGDTNDTTQLPGLVNTAAREYRMKELVADKGYIGKNNLELVNNLGAVPGQSHLEIVLLNLSHSAHDFSYIPL